MEEYDELSAGPNEEGTLDLSHNAWAELPDQLFGFASRILTLDLSHNKLLEVEADFGKVRRRSKTRGSASSVSVDSAFRGVPTAELRRFLFL